jgi:RNA polymerase sigma factor (sigma-70 family)
VSVFYTVKDGEARRPPVLEPEQESEEDTRSVKQQQAGDLIDAALVKRARAGDRRALGEIYDRYATSAYSLAVRLIGAAAAEDVMHDAFVTLMTKPDAFDARRGSFRSWFLSVVHHRCISLLRANHISVDETALAELPSADPEPADTIVQRLRGAAVREALMRLPEAQREALVLTYYGGLSQSALASRLGVPLGTIKARMRRGLVTLQTFLGGETLMDEERGR